MEPTDRQRLAGWIKFPPREVWDAAVAKGRVWQSLTRSGPGQCYGVRSFVRPGRHSCLFRPIDPHTGEHWPVDSDPVLPRVQALAHRLDPTTTEVDRWFGDLEDALDELMWHRKMHGGQLDADGP